MKRYPTAYRRGLSPDLRRQAEIAQGIQGRDAAPTFRSQEAQEIYDMLVIGDLIDTIEADPKTFGRRVDQAFERARQSSFNELIQRTENRQRVREATTRASPNRKPAFRQKTWAQLRAELARNRGGLQPREVAYVPRSQTLKGAAWIVPKSLQWRAWTLRATARAVPLLGIGLTVWDLSRLAGRYLKTRAPNPGGHAMPGWQQVSGPCGAGASYWRVPHSTAFVCDPTDYNSYPSAPLGHAYAPSYPPLETAILYQPRPDTNPSGGFANRQMSKRSKWQVPAGGTGLNPTRLPAPIPPRDPSASPLPKPWPQRNNGARPNSEDAATPRRRDEEATQGGYGPKPKPRPSGGPPRHVRRPPGPGERETKWVTGLDRASVVGRLVNGVTEAADMVDALYAALPEERRCWETAPGSGVCQRYADGNIVERKRSFVDKAKALYRHSDEIDINVALRELAVNQIEDAVFGRVGQVAGEFNRAFDLRIQTGPAL